MIAFFIQTLIYPVCAIAISVTSILMYRETGKTGAIGIALGFGIVGVTNLVGVALSWAAMSAADTYSNQPVVIPSGAPYTFYLGMLGMVVATIGFVVFVGQIKTKGAAT